LFKISKRTYEYLPLKCRSNLAAALHLKGVAVKAQKLSVRKLLKGDEDLIRGNKKRNIRSYTGFIFQGRVCNYLTWMRPKEKIEKLQHPNDN
jgi:hypothetical protein